MARADGYKWIGDKDKDGQPLEWFGGAYNIPARDLDASDTAAFSAEQWACIESETGKRLYAAVKPAAAKGVIDAD